MAAPLPGDILLVNDFSGNADWLGALIRDGERARGDGRPIWTHSALIVSDTEIVEALERGVVRSPITKYAHVQTKVIRMAATADDPRRVFAARYALKREGAAYGVVDFISLGFSLMFRNRWSTHIDGEPICSELCARATECFTAQGFPYAPERMMPSDLDRAFNFVPTLPPLGFWRRLGLLVSVTAKAALGLL